MGGSLNNAKRKDNHIEVWLNIRNKATFARKYPPSKVGDSVRAYIKPHTFKKGYQPLWSKGVCRITFIRNDQYLINAANRKRLWSRHELLKIEGAEGKDG